MNDYEQEREQRIAENKKRIEELGLQQALAELSGPSTTPASNRKRSRKQAAPERDDAEVRRSVRERKEVSYRETDFQLHGVGYATARKRVVVNIEDEEELAQLRAAVVDAPEAGGSAGKLRRPMDSGKGVRIQGGKVYDSKFGVTCHWCRQKTLENHVTCTRAECGGGKRLPVTFCHNCLRNRHGEDANLAHASKSWVCPPCRGSCGPGCIKCCNCGPCRKKANLEPTHQVVKLARAAGYDNVHDYLIHLARPKESEQEIADRKLKFPWGQWMHPGGATPDSPSTPPAVEAPHSTAPPPELVVNAEDSTSPADGNDSRKRGSKKAMVQKNMTEVFRAGKPRLSRTTFAKGKGLAQPEGKSVEQEEETDGEAEGKAPIEQAGVGVVRTVAPLVGLSRRQRIQMSLGLGPVGVTAGA